MKKICVTAMLMSLILFGCNSEEPKKSAEKNTPTSAIQAVVDKAQELIDKAETSLQSLAEKATEIKDAAWKAATDMAATVQNKSEQVTEKTTETHEAPAPADTHK